VADYGNGNGMDEPVGSIEVQQVRRDPEGRIVEAYASGGPEAGVTYTIRRLPLLTRWLTSCTVSLYRRLEVSSADSYDLHEGPGRSRCSV